MSKSLRFLTAVPIIFTALVVGEPGAGAAKEIGADPGIAFQAILEVEQTARLLAVLLDSGRAVINEYQPPLDVPGNSHKDLTPEVFERELIDMFRSRSGIDLRNLSGAHVPDQAKMLIKELAGVSRQVVVDAQPEIRRTGGTREFLPAIFGDRVAIRYIERTGVRIKQTTLAPRNPANAPDSTEQSALKLFADPGYPREKPISETTVKSGMLRLMFPLYTTRRCLDCHGEPKGALDRTGFPKEGLKLGQNAGAISVMIPMAK